jgi:hypothetical protein
MRAVEPASDAGVIPEFPEKSACRIVVAKCRVATQLFKNKAPPLAEPYLSKQLFVSAESAAEEQP